MEPFLPSCWIWSDFLMNDFIKLFIIFDCLCHKNENGILYQFPVNIGNMIF